MAAPPDALDLSLGEVEALALKAVRGTSLPWGAAEDAGRSAAWLARHAGTWAESLLTLLLAPPPPGQSPLLLAGALADGAVATLERLAAPLWVLPVLLFGPGRSHPLMLRLGAVEIRCNPGEAASATVTAETLATLTEAPVAMRLVDTRLPMLPHLMPPRFHRSHVGCATVTALEALAARTYVTASDESRSVSTGAAPLDDD